MSIDKRQAPANRRSGNAGGVTSNSAGFDASTLQGCSWASTLPGSTQPHFACGALITSDCLSRAVLHSRVVAQRLCGKGRSQSPSTALACLGYHLNSGWQAGMARPDFRAAATVRRALRGTGGGNSTACRCSFRSRVRQADTSLKGELDLRRIPDGNCQGNSGARIGVQARVTHDSPRGHKSEEGFFRCVTRRPATGLPGCLRWHSEFRRQSWIELKMRFSDSCGFHCSDLRFASLGLRPVRTNSLPKSGFLRQLCRTGVLPEVPPERPCSPGIRPNGLFHQGTRFRTITPATVAHVKRNNPEHQQAVRRRKP